MLSGGLDSLGMVYHLLTAPEYAEYFIHIHHIHIKNAENRTDAEAASVKSILRELSIMGLDFGYSESGITSPMYGTSAGTAAFMYDIQIVSYFAGFICSVNPEVVHVAIGMNSHETEETGSAQLMERRRRADQLLSVFTPVTKIFPVSHMNKREIYDSLPANLQDKFWSCRHPIYINDRTHACGKCYTCLHLKQSGIA